VSKVLSTVLLTLVSVQSLFGQGGMRSDVEQSVDRRLTACGTFKPECLNRFLDYPPNPTLADSPFILSIAEALKLAKHPFPPNPKFWAKDVDFSCASPWNSGSGRLRAGTAISARHVVFSKHFPLWKGNRLVFVGTDGTPCACYVDRTKAMPDCDIMIASLETELPPTVTPAKILPRDFTNYVGKVEGLPVVTLTQFEKAYVGDLMIPLTNSVYDLISFHEPETPLRRSFYERCRGGDSGSPTFLLVGNEPILLFCLTTGMGGYGLHRFSRQIQKMMDELCPGYKLETFDFRTKAQGTQH